MSFALRSPPIPLRLAVGWPLRLAVGCILIALLGLLPNRARAGGFYLTPFGAEPAGRAGARVAGVSTPHALWYNPAGLAYAKRQLLVDLSSTFVRSSFTRFVDDGSTDPTVHVRSSPLPMPTLAYSDDFGLHDWGFGIGLVLPPGYALTWPSEVDGQRAPQRYSILNANESAFGSIALAAAYRPVSPLSIGAALYLTAARVGGEVAVSACDYAVCLQPEAPEWEGRTRFLLGPVYTATAVFGLRYDFARVRLGASVQVRTKIAGEAEFDVLLPDQFAFDDVTLTNSRGERDLKADMKVVLPMVARFGVEVDVTQALAVELTSTWEAWSQQGDLTVRPRGVIARDVPGLGTVRAQPITVSSGARDTWSIALGGTQDLSPLTRATRALKVSAGAMYETSSVDRRDMSPAFLDSEKLLLAVGLSVGLSRRVLLDVSYGHTFMRNKTVVDSNVRLPEAIRPATVDPTPGVFEPGEPPRIGNGHYSIESNFFALGLRVHFDER
ncbi:MAG: outer membrane protein transport protein [Polyangiales bacterium]